MLFGLIRTEAELEAERRTRFLRGLILNTLAYEAGPHGMFAESIVAAVACRIGQETFSLADVEAMIAELVDEGELVCRGGLVSLGDVVA